MTPEDFAAKVDAEGGLDMAVTYGLRGNDLDDPNSDLARAWDEMVPMILRVERLLEELSE